MQKTNTKKFKKEATIQQKQRMVMLVFFGILVLLIFRLAFLQIVQGADLKEQMYEQLITSRIISTKRGTIYDSTGKALAISAQVDTVTINPTKIVITNDDDEIDESKTKELKEKVAKAFSEIFELDYDKTLKKVSSTSTLETIAQKVEQTKIDKLEAWMKENDLYSGINIDEDSKRYYPYDTLASNLIGFCGDDNQGLEGLESIWDSVLTGTPGRIITSQDATLEFIPDDNQTYIAAQNGNNITLTIDVNIQSIAEKYLKQACIENECENGGNVIIMNPNNGDVLAMATYPTYNSNTPFELTTASKEEQDKMNSEEFSNELQKMWNNRAITDTYEPGSVFKIITAAAGLEENLVETDTKNIFLCNGYEDVDGQNISCWKTEGHGYSSLRVALQSSCNPAFMQLGKLIGASTLYRYYNAFGFFNTTGFASSAERSGLFWDLEEVGSVELATMSFGQRFKITPLQMITAVCAVANDGVLMQPRIVKEIKNTDTNAVTTIDEVSVRQVISKDTANKLLDMLESVVTDGTGSYGQVKGYTIAGKTGTSEPDPGNPDEGYVASYAAISPVESPEIVVLVTLYNPKGDSHQGGQIAGPVVSQILTEVLPYLEIPSDSTTPVSDITTITLPNVTNKTVAEAKKILENAGLTYITSASDDDLVTEQMPKKGTSLVEDSVVMLYTSKNNARVSQTVPDLKGMSYNQAKHALTNKNLNISATGSGIVLSQDIIAGTSVEEGTVVSVTLQQEIEDAH